MDENVQPNEPVEVTTGEPGGETPKVDQPLTKEMIAEMMAEKIEEAKRHFQGVKDREVKAVRKEVSTFKRRAEQAESQINAFKQVAATNPQLARQIETATMAANAQAFREQENSYKAEEARQAYFDKMNGIIEGFGIDPTDKRLDMADDAEDSIIATDRIMTSVSKIIKENSKSAEAKRSQELKDFEARLRKDLGVDSIDNTSSTGSRSGIPTDMTRFRVWVDGLSLDEYKTKKPQIDDMMKKGLIK